MAVQCVGRRTATRAIRAARIRSAWDAIHAPDAVSCTWIRGSISLPTASIPVIPVATLTARAVASADRSLRDSKRCGDTAVDVIQDRSRHQIEVSRHGVRPDAADAIAVPRSRHADARVLATAVASSNQVAGWNQAVDAKARAAANRLVDAKEAVAVVEVPWREITVPGQANTSSNRRSTDPRARF